ncbi:MAG: TIM barrel protein [Oscillospiraceae bacterium]|nr:TIM barrel protein [Oscillospiraceae bacterium]
MIQSINFPISTYSIAPYGGWEKLGKQLYDLGLDGIEGIADLDNLDASFPSSLLSGYHMIFYPDWLDFYMENKSELLRKFGSMDMVEQFYRGAKPEDLMKQFKEDLTFALSMHTPYVVFHVSDVSIEEGYTYRWLHTDKEVLDGSINFINELLRDVEPTFDFLVENQWWPGFTFTDSKKTEYLLSNIEYPRVGIMLDTGHLINTNTKLRTQAEGIDYILKMIRLHDNIKDRILGIHFHQSLSGRYVQKHTGQLPDDLPGDYYEAYSMEYPHIERIDRHNPWTDPRCVEILEEVRPKYLTHELSSKPHRLQLTAVKRQLRTIRQGYSV